MEPIHVPAPPKSAFNKNRRTSDLLVGQLKHFQHVAHKQGIDIDPVLAQDIHTEAGAARYITQMTRAIREQGQAKPTRLAVLTPALPPDKSLLKARGKQTGLSLAAAGQPSHSSITANTNEVIKKEKKKSSRRRKS